MEKEITVLVAEIIVVGAAWTLFSVGVGLVLSWLFHKEDFAKLREEIREKQPVKAKLNQEFHIGFWTDPKDNQRKQIWIPKVWLEYEDGSVKPLNIDELCERRGINLAPFGAISFREKE